MTIELESLLLAIAFIVPGFLTSKLISARTPSRSIQSTTFEDTAESILRSVYINLVVAVLAIFAYLLFLRHEFPVLAESMERMGLLSFIHNFQNVGFIGATAWLVLAFAVALLFGAYKDPLHSLMLRLSRSRGATSIDSIAYLRESAIRRRDETGMPSRLWFRIIMNSGAIYRGEFVTSSYRDPNLNREILLTNVFYVAPGEEVTTSKPGRKLHFVLIGLENTEAVEVAYSDVEGGSA